MYTRTTTVTVITCPLTTYSFSTGVAPMSASTTTISAGATATCTSPVICPGCQGQQYADGSGASYQVQCDRSFSGSVIPDSSNMSIGQKRSIQPTIQACLATCDGTIDCVAAVLTGETCTLYSSIVGVAPFAGAEAGVRSAYAAANAAILNFMMSSSSGSTADSPFSSQLSDYISNQISENSPATTNLDISVSITPSTSSSSSSSSSRVDVDSSQTSDTTSTDTDVSVASTATPSISGTSGASSSQSSSSGSSASSSTVTPPSSSSAQTSISSSRASSTSNLSIISISTTTSSSGMSSVSSQTSSSRSSTSSPFSWILTPTTPSSSKSATSSTPSSSSQSASDITSGSSSVSPTTSTSSVSASTSASVSFQNPDISSSSRLSSSTSSSSGTSSSPESSSSVSSTTTLSFSNPTNLPSSSSSSSTTSPTSTLTTSPTSTSTTSSTSTSSSSSTSPTPIPNNGKRGLSYNQANLTMPYSLSGQNSQVSWAYNWFYRSCPEGQTSCGYNPAIQFIPLLYSNAANLLRAWPTAAQEAINAGTPALMSFNEPDVCFVGSACMSVDASVSTYQQYMQPFAGRALLGAPAVTNGGSPFGLTYLSWFLGNCTGCTIDFINVHWYSNKYAGASYFEYFVNEARAVANGRPIWVTEFGLNNENPYTEAELQAFLQQVMPWMDQQPDVARYAYFMNAPGILINSAGTDLSTTGVVYNTFTNATTQPDLFR